MSSSIILMLRLNKLITKVHFMNIHFRHIISFFFGSFYRTLKKPMYSLGESIRLAEQLKFRTKSILYEKAVSKVKKQDRGKTNIVVNTIRFRLHF